ncbi:DUF4062 domain-containing protein [Lentzea aerocolonigenes]|uniref:DUF4062 domain-containing protein n=1 Tax=Lentzea aerocolonigenes TaxID=68170 RepID=UPI0004C3B2AD|nr:DUF4062 domain-containing protein [Lentzea aerocolonigenes]MCP2241900.1 NACHT domain-containing protein [Lentzea aerocolonigenes]
MRVYVSSTFLDLQECREVVHRTLRRLQIDDVTMEYYVAEPDRPVDVCLRDVRSCDVYLGIFAWRYGHVPEGHGGLSITELEYRAAIDADKPCLIFMLDENASWPRPFMDRDPEAIETLRAELAERHTPSHFRVAADLGIEVATALHRHMTSADDPARRLDQLDPAVVTAYYRRLQKEYGRLDLDALTPPEREEYLQILLEQVFVEQHVREDPPPVKLPPELLQRLQAEGEIDEAALPEGVDLADLRAAQESYRAKPQRPVLDVVMGADRHVVVLGDPGAGKSTLARFAVLDLAGVSRRLTPLAGTLPLLVELRQYAAAREAGSCRTILEFLDELATTQTLGIARRHLEPYLEAGGAALVVFDGLDEIFDPGRREEATKEIASFADRYPGVRVLVTSRVDGYHSRRLTDAGFVHHTLQDLDADQIADFLGSWYTLALHDRPGEAAQRRDRLLEAVRESRPIGDLAGNPLLLTILAIIGKHQTLPRERWKVYDHAARVLVQHWDIKRQLRERRVAADYIDEDDKRELLRRLAWRMQTGADGSTGNYVHREDLQRLFEDYLVETYARNPADAKIVATVIIDQFQHRNFILSRFGPNLYSFVHRAFLEFFCADAVVRRFQREQSITLDDVVALFVERCGDTSWREVLRLLASVLAEHHVGEIARRLLEVDRPWPVNEFAAPPHGLIVAVQCLGELRSMRAVEEVAKAALVEVVLLLEHCVGIEDTFTHQLIDSDVLPALRAIGPAWPGRDLFADWYVSRGRWLIWSPVTRLSASLLTILFIDRPDVLVRVVHLDEVNDSRAAEALSGAAAELERSPATEGSQGAGPMAPDTAVLSTLTTAVSTGTASAVHWALQMLDRLGSADVVDELLWDRFLHDDDKDVFRAAATGLLRRHPGHQRVLDTVANRIEHAGSSPLAGVCADVLAEHDPTRPRLALLTTLKRVQEPLSPFDEEEDPVETQQISTARDQDILWARLGEVAKQATAFYQARYNALVVLDRVAPADFVEELLWDRLLHDDDDDVFRVAVTSLLRRHPGDQHVLNAVANRVEQDTDTPLARVCAEVLIEHGATHPHLPLLTTLARILYSDSLLSEEEEVSAEVRRIRDAHGRDDMVLARLRNAAAAITTSYQARHNALVVLDRVAPADFVEELMWDRLLRDDDDDVFRVAVTSLLRRHPGDQHVLNAVADRVEQRPETALARVGLEVLPEHDPARPRLTLLTTLAEILGSDPLFFDEKKVAAAAERVLGAHDDHDAVAAVLGDLTKNSQAFYDIRCNALIVLDRIAPADLVEELMWDRLLHDDDDDVIAVAVTSLLRRHPGDQHVLDTVVNRLEENPDAPLAHASVELLIEHDPARLRPLLVESDRFQLHLGTRLVIAGDRLSVGDLPELADFGPSTIRLRSDEPAPDDN